MSGSSATPHEVIRLVELYCGIGGVAAAVRDRQTRVVGAFDVSTLALSVYRHNFAHRASGRAIESFSPGELAALRADGWWASPPCQPFTRRGRRRDLDDPRAASYPHLAELLDAVRPDTFALENVPGFAGSAADQLLTDTLQRAGYAYRHELLCPTQLGIPNRRERLYLLASRREPPRPPVLRTASRPISGYLDSAAATDEDLRAPAGLVERYRGALSIVDPADPSAVTSCFTSAYGRSPVRSGSYLCQGGGLRRFSPTEVLSVLGFPADYRWPDTCSRAQAWRLAGNALSVPMVRVALDCLGLTSGSA